MACMDLEKIEEKGLEPLLSLLKKFGGWPVLEDNWNEANFKWYLFTIVIIFKNVYKIHRSPCVKNTLGVFRSFLQRSLSNDNSFLDHILNIFYHFLLGMS